jgi:hypothetical protein
MLKISAFYLDKQKFFIPKKKVITFLIYGFEKKTFIKKNIAKNIAISGTLECCHELFFSRMLIFSHLFFLP